MTDDINYSFFVQGPTLVVLCPRCGDLLEVTGCLYRSGDRLAVEAHLCGEDDVPVVDVTVTVRDGESLDEQRMRDCLADRGYAVVSIGRYQLPS